MVAPDGEVPSQEENVPPPWLAGFDTSPRLIQILSETPTSRPAGHSRLFHVQAR
jgi:hypothetical protein